MQHDKLDTQDAYDDATKLLIANLPRNANIIKKQSLTDVSFLADGGQGTVYSAQWNKQNVALKIIEDEETFIKEVRVLR